MGGAFPVAVPGAQCTGPGPSRQGMESACAVVRSLTPGRATSSSVKMQGLLGGPSTCCAYSSREDTSRAAHPALLLPAGAAPGHGAAFCFCDTARVTSLTLRGDRLWLVSAFVLSWLRRPGPVQAHCVRAGARGAAGLSPHGICHLKASGSKSEPGRAGCQCPPQGVPQ